MPASPGLKVFPRVVAGFISAVVGLILAYVAGVVAIAVTLQDFTATLLASVTVLPLMLLFVFLLPELFITGTTGLVLNRDRRKA